MSFGSRAIFSIPIARPNQSQSALTKLSDNLNLADDVFVERVQVLRWNPVFRMERAPDLLNAKSTQVLRPHRKLLEPGGRPCRTSRAVCGRFGSF
jgi:hypothetical protein